MGLTEVGRTKSGGKWIVVSEDDRGMKYIHREETRRDGTTALFPSNTEPQIQAAIAAHLISPWKK